MDPDIKVFVDAVGATTPLEGTEHYEKFRTIFKRENYFTLDKRFLVIKISRSEKPFWGLTKSIIDFVNELDDYSLVLLTSPTAGWIFSKSQVNDHIESGAWALRKADGNYKINMPLPEDNAFSLASYFRKKIHADV